MILIIMGVSGCGKSTVGEALAEQLKWKFAEADNFHSKANKDKMSKGIPLTDEDREPWLRDIHNYIKELVIQNQHCVVTCSALKQSYRNILLHGTPSIQQNNSPTDSQSALTINTTFVHLKGSKKTLTERIEARKNHFMPLTLLDSQIATLEEPTECRHVVVDINRTLEDIISSLVDYVQSTA